MTYENFKTLSLSSIQIIPDESWPEKESDVLAALKIIQDYSQKNGGFKLIESFEEKGDDLTIVMPEWQESLFKYFLPLYGEQSSEVIGQITGIIFEEIFGPMPEEMKHKGKLVRINHQ